MSLKSLSRLYFPGASIRIYVESDDQWASAYAVIENEDDESGSIFDFFHYESVAANYDLAVKCATVMLSFSTAPTVDEFLKMVKESDELPGDCLLIPL